MSGSEQPLVFGCEAGWEPQDPSSQFKGWEVQDLVGGGGRRQTVLAASCGCQEQA